MKRFFYLIIVLFAFMVGVSRGATAGDGIVAGGQVVAGNAGDKESGFFRVAKTGKRYHVLALWEAIAIAVIIVFVFHIAITRRKR
ncbi:MAG: hypothetical protein Kow0090_10190 [Myxococcota bacterium]